jgi:hypothetical protein
MKNRFLLIAATILAAGLLATANLRAQDEEQPQGPPPNQPQAQQQPQGQQQPQTTVARISVVHGNVSTMRGDGGQWVAATVNTPVVPGDEVATAERSSAEVQLDFANILRFSERTEAKVADLEQNKIQIQLASGLVVFTANNDTQADAEIDTPNMGVHPLRPGVYRIQVNSDTDTQLIVRVGEAEILTNEGSTKVEAGQVIQIHGADNPEYKIDPAPAGDDFDRWCSDRDRQIQSAQAWQHTDQYYTGSSDLDANGQWQEVPDYGWCWTPQVDMGWVPYSVGRWGWEPYWGWTWISYEPWGWAPYHYGRWFMYGNRWMWWPARGFYGPRPIWAPAYVSFFGFGRGVGFGFGFGSIGWLALGPRDIFHPWFGPGHAFSAVSFDNLRRGGFVTPGGRPFGSNLERAMTDARMRNAVMHVSAQDFASGRVTRSGPVSESMLRNASMVRGTVPIVHNAASLGNRTASPSSFRSSTAGGEHFFSRSGATTAGRTSSFSSGRAETGSFGNRGSSNSYQRFGSANSSSRWPTPVSGGFQGRSSPTTRGSQNNWQRFASPNPYSGRNGSGASNGRSGWGGYSSRPAGNSGGSYSRPLNLSQPIMRQRAPSNSSSGGRTSSPSSGGHTYSAPRSSGGGGRSSGGGHGGGHR